MKVPPVSSKYVKEYMDPPEKMEYMDPPEKMDPPVVLAHDFKIKRSSGEKFNTIKIGINFNMRIIPL